MGLGGIYALTGYKDTSVQAVGNPFSIRAAIQDGRVDVPALHERRAGAQYRQRHLNQPAG